MWLYLYQFNGGSETFALEGTYDAGIRSIPGKEEIVIYLLV